IYNVQTRGIAIGDLNGDGKPDLVIADGHIHVALNNGNGVFASPVDITPSQRGFYFYVEVQIGDFNADGRPDIAAANGNSGSITLFINNGNGAFTKSVDYEAGDIAGLRLGDFNGDGNLDVLA